MIRVKKKPDLILTADWHLREDTPTCWTGDFNTEQWLSVQCVKNLQAKYDCPVIHAGDLFNHWKPSPWLLSMTVIHLPKRFYTIYGQHDMPQHNFELITKSGIYNLDISQKLTVCNGVHYGQIPHSGLFPHSTLPLNILVWHHMTYLAKPFPGASEGVAEGILRKYPEYDLIVTGDNHASFTVEYRGRRLVNPGSLTRQDADQIDFNPSVYLWYARDNTVQEVHLPIQEGVISREHIEGKEQRDARIDAFVSRLNNDWQASMSFEENLEEFKNANNIDDDVIQIIYKSIEK